MVNDSLGHLAGDGLLVEVAQRLQGCLRLTDLVARLSGDEFAVMLTQLRSVEDAALISSRLQQSLVEPFQVAGREVYTSASIGIVLRSGENVTAEDLLRDADIALHRAKVNGKSRFELFDPQMHEQAKKLMQLETDLRLALQRNEFVVYYQPIITLKTGRLSGFESLIRWNHPERGIVGPVDFISISEENGLINPIGHWVLKESCRQLVEWQKEFSQCAALTISVNLSGIQLATPGLIENIKVILNETEINPTCLKLEITESVIMDNANVAADILGQLKALGVRLAIDDFGTGYSSFGHLHKFPIDTLKIDRSFVNQMELSTESAEIIKTILVMAHNLHKEVVAEGVENTAQIEQLRSLGCDLGQGFFINHPMKAEAAVKLVAEENELQSKDVKPLSGYAAR
jgi:diguanylate cyclase (GGDEF)-like protein